MPRDSSVRRNALACNTARRKNMQPSLNLSLSLSRLSLQSYFLCVRTMCHAHVCGYTRARGERCTRRGAYCTRVCICTQECDHSCHNDDDDDDDDDSSVSVCVMSGVVKRKIQERCGFTSRSARAAPHWIRGEILRLESVMAKFIESLMVDLAVDRGRRAFAEHGIAQLDANCLGLRMCRNFC